MTRCCQVSSHYLTQCWLRPLTEYSTSKPQRVNTLWPSDTICRHKSGSALAQVMACCLTASSHYLNNVDLSSVRFSGIHLRANFTRDTSAISHWNSLENYLSKILFKSSRGLWVKYMPATRSLPTDPFITALSPTAGAHLSRNSKQSNRDGLNNWHYSSVLTSQIVCIFTALFTCLPCSPRMYHGRS